MKISLQNSNMVKLEKLLSSNIARKTSMTALTKSENSHIVFTTTTQPNKNKNNSTKQNKTIGFDTIKINLV